MGSRTLYLVDATAFCYRAFYALRGLTTSSGQPTNAIYGFVVMLNKILKKYHPDLLGVCFDVSRDTFRLKKFADYKIQRPPMPDALSSQMPFIKEIVTALGITVLQKEGFEADDVIATVARIAKKEGLSVTIVTSDKDILQLVDEHTVVLSPHKDEDILYDAAKVQERFGVPPERITDIIALMGDDVDNIPGVPGIGEKTAVGLLKTFGTLDNLLENLDRLEPPKRKLISEHIDKIKLSKELAKLDESVDLGLSLDELKMRESNVQELLRLYKHLELKSFVRDLPLEEDESRQVNVETLEDRDLKGLVSSGDELVLSGDSIKEMVFHAQNRYFRLNNAGNALKAILADPTIRKVGHDLKTLKVLLERDEMQLAGIAFDTMIAAYVLNSSRSSYHVADLALDYLGVMHRAESLNTTKAAELIVGLKKKLEEELRSNSLEKLFNDIEMPLVEVLADIQTAGIRLDEKVLTELSRDIEKRLIKLIEDIYELSGAQFNINSPKQLREILFEKLKLPVVKRTKTGPSTDEEVLRNLADKHKLPALLLEYRQLMKLKTTYIDTLPGLIDPRTHRIHASFNQTGTETGRLSSSNPNLQNLPVKTDIGRKIRQAVISSGKDAWLLSCDYSQIELRILAHLCGDENLISAFKSDEDIHKATAALIYGLKERDIDGPMREVAKRVNFGIVYGLTPFGLSRDLGIPQQEAESFIDAYFLRYPKVKEYIQHQITEAEENGFVATILGRRRAIPEISNKNQSIRQFAQRQAVNTPIQGSASDLIKLAMIQIHRLIKQKSMETKMVLQVHDELVFDVPHQELEEAVALVKDRMEHVMQLEVPIKVDIKKGKNWLEMEAMR